MQEKGYPKKKVTILDVASDASVSPSTVSHVINQTATISKETTQRVQESIAKLNYIPNAMARGLRQKKSKLLGLILPDISNMFYAKCASGFLETSASFGATVTICATNYNRALEHENVTTLMERRVDGLVFLGGLDDQIVIKAHDHGIPVVLGDRYLRGFPCVEFDYADKMKEFIAQLSQDGITRIGYISEPLTMTSALKRYRCFVNAMQQNNLPIFPSDIMVDPALQMNKIDAAEQLIHRWLAEPENTLPQVLFCSSDNIAIGLMQGLLSCGISIPEDIEVIGFDDIDAAKICRPSLTTIRQDAFLLGKKCFELLHWEMEHEDGLENPGSPNITLKIIERNSTKERSSI